jgi:hypothetical protein
MDVKKRLKLKQIVRIFILSKAEIDWATID